MGDLSEFTNFAKFICEKIEKATGLAFDPFGAKKKAVDNYIERIKAEKLDPFLEMALISNPRKYMKEYLRQNDILRLAIEELESRREKKYKQEKECQEKECQEKDDQDYSKAEKVDDEWLSRFFDSAKYVSDEEVQIIWGKILADEFAAPGTVPKRLINTLSYINKSEADLFLRLCSHSLLRNSQIVPFIDYQDSVDYWVDNDVTYDGLLNLQSIGLISFRSESQIVSYGIDEEALLNKQIYIDYTYPSRSLIVIKDTSKIIPKRHVTLITGNVIFTSVGEALYKLINVEYNEAAVKHITILLKNQGFEVEIIPTDK